MQISLPTLIPCIALLVFITLIVWWVINTVFSNCAIHPIELAAKKFALKAHKAVNQKYGNKPYSFHLQMVRDFAFKYRHLIPDPTVWPTIFAACWCHDLIEDARQTYNDISKALGKQIAEISYALTNDKGKNRAERAGDNYYKGINETEYAGFVKICDRLANIKYSADNQSRMLEKYKKEFPEFKRHLYFEPYKPMFEEMADLLEIMPTEQK